MTDGTQKCRCGHEQSLHAGPIGGCVEIVALGKIVVSCSCLFFTPEPSAPVGGERAPGEIADDGVARALGKTLCGCGHAYAVHEQHSMDSAECGVKGCECEYFGVADQDAVDFEGADDIASGETIGSPLHPLGPSGLTAYAVRKLAIAYRATRALSGPRVAPEAGAGEMLQEKYWCGCVREARWTRCERHPHLDHDDEPMTRREEEDAALPVERGPSKVEAWALWSTDCGYDYIFNREQDARDVHASQNLLNPSDGTSAIEVRPLYRHPAPVGSGEVTEEMVEQMATDLWDEYWPFYLSEREEACVFSLAPLPMQAMCREAADRFLRAALAGAER